MTLLAALLAPAAALWAAVLFRRGGLAASCLFVLGTGVCLGPFFFHASVGPVQISLDRLLWLALMACYPLARVTGGSVARPLDRADVVLGGFYLVVVASVLAFDFRHADSRPVSQLLFYHVLPLGIYWVARHAIYTRRTVTGLLAGLAVFGIYLGLTAIAETHELGWLVFPRYIASSEYTEFFGRARGPLMNPAGAGILLGLCLAAAALLWLNAGRAGRALLGATCLLILVGVSCTMTRTAWLGAGLGLLGIAGVTMPRRWRLPAVAACVLAAGVVGATQGVSLLRFRRDKAQTAADTADSVKLRPILAVVALKMFAERPLTGCGFAHYPEAHEQYLHERPWGLPLEKAGPYIQHNVLLNYLV
ncbi:MAG: O-antigen ligase family protein, partial [Thermoguttaceae bacterium]